METGELGGSKDDAAVVFEVKDEKLFRVKPKASFDEAMEAADLGDEDLIASLAG